MSTTVTYQPNNSLRRGYLHIFGDIAKELYQNRWLTYQLFRRDILALYKQSIFGVIWMLVTPLASIGTFVLLNRAGIFNIGSLTTPYAIYALLGTIFWQIFATGVVGCTMSLVAAGGMLSKINFSRKSLVLATTGQSLVVFAIQFVLVALLFIAYKVTPDAIAIISPLFIIPIFLFTLGIGFILALLNAVIRDIGSILPLIVTFLLFLTPILYVAPQSGALAILTKYNPLYYLVAVPRQLILTGSSGDLNAYGLSCLIAVVIFVIGLVSFHLTETRITERV